MEIKKLRYIDIFFLIVIIAFVFDFGNLKYFMALIFSFFYAFNKIIKNNGIFSIKIFAKESLLLFSSFFILCIITLILQLINGFNIYFINEIIYFITPLFFVLIFVQYSNKHQINDIIIWSFYICVINFIYSFATKITISNILLISFVNSYSPFESELAFLFFIFELFFLAQSKKKHAIISMVLCVLSFKRISTIFSILLLFFSKYISNNIKVKKVYITIMTFAFTVLVVLTCVLSSNDFSVWFYNAFGISLSELTLSRSDRLVMVINSDKIIYGLGSVTTYITESLNNLHGSSFASRSLHNDLVKLYLECGIVGYSFFIYAYIKISSMNLNTFILINYIFFECYFNHLFGAGTTQMWIIIYLILVFNRQER